MSDRTYYEIAMERLAEDLREANERDAKAAATDPRNADQQGVRR
ncbi:hypothetical protein AB0K60_07155 [Thermopolyspora sp. NPDC052614]